MRQTLVVYYCTGKVGQGRVIGGWDALRQDAEKRFGLQDRQQLFVASLPEEEQERLSLFPCAPRDDSVGEGECAIYRI
jgi:hypothetical protein